MNYFFSSFLMAAFGTLSLSAIETNSKPNNQDRPSQELSRLSQEEIAAQRSGLAKWEQIADTSPRVANEHVIETLAEGIRKTSRPIIYSIEGTAEVSAKLKNALLSIPGHAKYFQDKIESMRAEVLATTNLPYEEISKLERNGHKVPHVSDYEDYCSMTAFSTLAHLPSPETVAVLGHYLNETTGRDGKTLLGDPRRFPGSDDLSLRPCNAELAALAVGRLDIEHPPYPKLKPNTLLPKIPDEMVDAWKDWWNEVKDGKRTYRFIGSSIDYGPDGPATKEQLERIALNRRMESDRATRHGSAGNGVNAGNLAADVPVSRKPAIYAVIAAAFAVLAAIVWYFRRAKPAR